MSNTLEDVLAAIGPNKLRELADALEDSPQREPVEIEVNVDNPELNEPEQQKTSDGTCVRTGKYKVQWIPPSYNGEEGVLSLKKDFHDDSPMLDSKHPYIGPLCEHELAFLTSVPGLNYSYTWRFEVREITNK